MGDPIIEDTNTTEYYEDSEIESISNSITSPFPDDTKINNEMIHLSVNDISDNEAYDTEHDEWDGSDGAQTPDAPSTPQSCQHNENLIEKEDLSFNLSKHLFFGPSDTDPIHSKTLHGKRHADLTKLCFKSEPFRSENTTNCNNEKDKNTREKYIKAIFKDDTLGFGTKIVINDKDKTRSVIVAYVEPKSTAYCADIIEGDILISLNGDLIEPNLKESEILNIIKDAKNPRTMIFKRIYNKKYSNEESRSFIDTEDVIIKTNENTDEEEDDRIISPSSPQYNRNNKKKKKQKSRDSIGDSLSFVSGRLSYLSSGISKFSNAKKIIKNTVNITRNNINKKTNPSITESIYDHPDILNQIHHGMICDGCGLDPVKGILWTCSICTDQFNLCNDCYSNGIHGMEDSDEMKNISIGKIEEKLKKKTKHFNKKFLLSLRRDICKDHIEKFEYMGIWLGDIVNGIPASKIKVRGIEIPHLSIEARQRFVGMLMPLACNRMDIEVNIEWLEELNTTNENINRNNNTLPEKTEKLRIWISDKRNRTKSPFMTNES